MINKFRTFNLICLLIISLSLFSGCNDSNNEVIEIKEKTFLTQINDIMLNQDKYLEKTIIIEGIFFKTIIDEEELTAVYRNTPGCCGNDGIAGFDLLIDQKENSTVNIPSENDWVKVAGKLERYYKDNEKDTLYLRLKVSNIEIKETRGKEFVIE